MHDSIEFHEKMSAITKRIVTTTCKYCGRKYQYRPGGFYVTVYHLDLYAFEPKITSEFYNIRQPFKCKGCAAGIMLNK